MPDMIRAALSYAAAGWPVAPVWPPAPAHHERIRVRLRGSGEKAQCTCPAGATCPTPAEHLAGGPTVDARRIRRTWSERSWNIAVHTGTVVDVIETGRALGAQAMRVLERGRSPYPAVARTVSGRWLFVVAASDRVPELPDCAVLHGKGAWVLAPPSRHGIGRDRWVWVPRPHRLADPMRVVEALHAVRLYPWEVGTDDHPAARSRTGAL